LRSCSYSYIGNLDADVAFEPTFFAQLLEKFDQEPGFGLGGGNDL
jgi:cellulose synthase/poly-beta-1,6-N-acetylglucosamine synthase-like glycosyltransferase